MADLHRLDSVRYHGCAHVASQVMLVHDRTALSAHLALCPVFNRSGYQTRPNIAVLKVVV